MAGNGKIKNDPETWEGRLRSAMQGVGTLNGFSVSEQSRPLQGHLQAQRKEQFEDA